MYIRPVPGVTLERWTLSQEKPEPAHMPPDMQETTYFIYYSHGEKPVTPWSFSLYFKVLHLFNFLDPLGEWIPFHWGSNSSISGLSPSEKWSTLKGKNLLPLGSKFFPFRVVHFYEGFPLEAGFSS